MSDELIPIAQAECPVAALRASSVAVEFITINGVYHNWASLELPPGHARECDLGPLALPFFKSASNPNTVPSGLEPLQTRTCG
jgi:hypothetical protein